ncbi:hypothetical protein HDU98_012308 [Podochytrium sp. JEL0797]|nr:hypothetical protein HDU98_012308 [Podochytrium sp. JEL0797]
MSSRVLPFAAGVIVSATAYSIFSAQIQHDTSYSRHQLSQMSVKVLRAADEPVPPTLITKEGYLSKVLPASSDVFGTISIRAHANNAVEYWNGGVRNVAAALTGGKP